MIVDRQFCQLLDGIRTWGNEIDTRNSKTKRLINQAMRFDSTPLISIRRTAWKNALREMEWFMSGSNNINDLHPKVHHWWSEWANDDGIIENNYSKQFRAFMGTTGALDQIDHAIKSLKNHPYSRRNVLTTWNSAEMASATTPITNCHGTMIQLHVEPDNKVHMMMVQRSCDMVLGVPHNLIQYWAFLMYLCHRSGREVGSFTWIGGDCHIYNNHLEMTDKMIKRVGEVEETPQLVYTPTSDDFKADDFTLNGEYNPIIKENLEMTV